MKRYTVMNGSYIKLYYVIEYQAIMIFNDR